MLIRKRKKTTGKTYQLVDVVLSIEPPVVRQFDLVSSRSLTDDVAILRHGLQNVDQSLHQACVLTEHAAQRYVQNRALLFGELWIDKARFVISLLQSFG